MGNGERNYYYTPDCVIYNYAIHLFPSLWQYPVNFDLDPARSSSRVVSHSKQQSPAARSRTGTVNHNCLIRISQRQKTMAISTRCTHLFVVIWGSVEIALFAGQIFGWASLVYVLKQQGYFGESCQVGAQLNETSILSGTDLNGLHNGSVGYNYSRLRRDAETHFVGLNQNSSSDDDERDAILTDRKLPPFKGEGEEGDGFTCVSQDESLGLVYTVAVVINGCLSVVIGSMLDHLGTRITRSLGM